MFKRMFRGKSLLHSFFDGFRMKSTYEISSEYFEIHLNLN